MYRHRQRTDHILYFSFKIKIYTQAIKILIVDFSFSIKTSAIILLYEDYFILSFLESIHIDNNIFFRKIIIVYIWIKV